MQVSQIKAIDKKRVKVYIDEELAFPLYLSEVRRYEIAEGVELSDEKYGEILTQIIYKRAKERALYILKDSDKTEREISDKLAGGAYPPAVINKTLEFLREYGYVDDERYAREYISSRSKSRSLKEIKNKLFIKGIHRDIIDNELEEFAKDELYDAKELIYKLLEKKRFNFEEVDPFSMANQKETRRILSFLMRKGFEYDDIINCMKNRNLEKKN